MARAIPPRKSRTTSGAGARGEELCCLRSQRREAGALCQSAPRPPPLVPGAVTARNETRLSGETEFHPPLIPLERCFSLSVTRDRGWCGVADPVIAEAATLQMKD